MGFTQAQLQQAARAGGAILVDSDIRVPVKMASSGDLSLLRMVMESLSTGKLVIVEPAVYEQGLAAIKALEEMDSGE